MGGKFGPIIAAMAINEFGMECVGAVTRSSNHGKKLSDLISLNSKLTTPVTITPASELASLLSSKKPDVVFLATTNTINATFDQIKLILDTGVNVISIGEEAWYPWTTPPVKSKALDELSKKKGLAVIGTGGRIMQIEC